MQKKLQMRVSSKRFHRKNIRRSYRCTSLTSKLLRNIIATRDTKKGHFCSYVYLHYLRDIFLRYDKNEDGLLNAEELRPCIIAHSITQAQCATFLKSIDLSGDGNKSEMTHFISEGILLSPAMKHSTLKVHFIKPLLNFLTA